MLRLVFLLLLVALAGGLFATNPTQDEFADFAGTAVGDQIRDFVPGGGLLGRLGGIAIREIVERQAERQNFALFSLYTLDFNGAADGEEWQFLGIGHQFIELKRPATVENVAS